MNRVAVISDIHSNSVALKAVLNKINELNIETVLCSGDIIGYHTFPNETIKLMRDSGVISIAGNHDLDVIAEKFNPDKKPDIFKFTHDLLTEDNLNWLKSLPKNLQISINNRSFFIFYVSPVDEEEYLYEGEANSEGYADNCSCDLLISGHTHLPWIKKYKNTLFINSGSVGKPKNGSPKASFAVIDLNTKQIDAEINFVEYPVEECAESVEKAGFTKYADALRTGVA